MNEITTIKDIQSTQVLSNELLKLPHYAKIGPLGVFAIVETAKSLNIDTRTALLGGMFYTNGKVELTARLMNTLIRSKKHSISQDPKSDDTICILHGKRADNGDTWTESYSIKEAEHAGLLRRKRNTQTQKEIDGPWQLYPKDMLFARALSRLARRLFPDIIGNCYVEGEIVPFEVMQEAEAEVITKIVEPKISAEQLDCLEKLGMDVGPIFDQKIKNRIFTGNSISSYHELDVSQYEEVVAFYLRAINHINSQIPETNIEKD